MRSQTLRRFLTNTALMGVLLGPVAQADLAALPAVDCEAPLLSHLEGADLKSYYLKGGTDLEFQLQRGENEQNFFLRKGSNQSHTVVNNGEHAQLETAFLAGNSSVALFPVASDSLKFEVLSKPAAFAAGDEHGVRYTVSVNQPTMDVKNVVAGSTRDYRDYEHFELEYPDAKVQPVVQGNRVVYSRERLDKKGRYLMQVTVMNGSVSMKDGRVHFASNSGEPLRLVIDALTSEGAYAPLAATKMFNKDVLQRLSVEDIQAAMFLTTSEKIVAGSHRYLTYFGRDIFLTLIYNAEFLRPEIMEVALAAGFEREADGTVAGADNGDIAHEEDIGDIATRRNIQMGRGAVSTPIYDYKMVDTVYLLAPLFEAYLQKVGAGRAARFLSRKTAGGRTYRDAFKANLELVLKRTQAFADNPVYQNLIAFKDGEVVGDWRDSGNGHGATTDQEEAAFKTAGIERDRTSTGGRYSFGVNVALVPSALRLASQFFVNPGLAMFNETEAARAQRYFAVWNVKARALFQQTATPFEATRGARAFLGSLGLTSPQALTGSFNFSALSLDREGRPIKVIHSDEGFDLLLNHPSEEVLKDVAGSLLRVWPYGLSVPGVGMAVANPIMINDAEMCARFNPDEYHGGVWGCEMAKMERGFAAQLSRREDLSADTRALLEKAHRALWGVLEEQSSHKKEELWSWRVENGQPVYKPYKEANALQTWNLSLLLLQNPYVGARAARANK